MMKQENDGFEQVAVPTWGRYVKIAALFVVFNDSIANGTELVWTKRMKHAI